MDFAGHSTVRVGDFEERADDARAGIGETREDGISRDDGRSRELTGARFPDTVCVWPAVAHCMRSDTSHFKRETISFVVVAVAVPVWRCHRRTRYRCRVQHTCACGVSGHTHTHTRPEYTREKTQKHRTVGGRVITRCAGGHGLSIISCIPHAEDDNAPQGPIYARVPL